MLEFTAFELLTQCGYSKTCTEQESEPLLLRVWNFGIMDRTVEGVEDGSDLNFDETAAGIESEGVLAFAFLLKGDWIFSSPLRERIIVNVRRN